MSQELALVLVEHGITVHLVTHPAGGTLLVYLEEKLGEWEQAAAVVYRMPEVCRVSFSDSSKAMMFVHLAHH